MSSTEVAAERAPRLFSGPHLPLVLGVIALVTLGAFENRPGLIGWTVAGIGMGLSSSSLSVLTLDLSDANNSGRNTGAAQMAGTMSIATALAVSGTVLALNASDPGPWVFGAIITASAARALAALATSIRIRRD